MKLGYKLGNTIWMTRNSPKCNCPLGYGNIDKIYFGLIRELGCFVKSITVDQYLLI